MKQDFRKYFRAIDITKPLRERIETIYEFYADTFPFDITDIFIEDYIQEDSTRNYEGLWFFSERYVMEAKQFLKKDIFDIVSIYKQITYLTISKQNYDFKSAREKSRLNVAFRTPYPISGDLKASRKNCDYLKDICLRYLIPNLM